jgi:hypothetical protein
MSNIIKNNFLKKCSQARQDRFAFNISGSNGTYIEIGAHQPSKRSNTYNLEVMAGWKGFSVELDTKYQQSWKDCTERKNPVYWGDAITFDYANALSINSLPKHINYLSCDIEPPVNTFSALKRVIEQGISFDFISFEHDRYQCSEDYHTIANEFLSNYGYKVAVYDVYFKVPTNVFETWFVKDTVKFDTISYANWLATIAASQETQ